MGGDQAGQEAEGGIMNTEAGTDGQPPVAGGVVALGKFDGVHVGHRALAERASQLGPPVMLSFSGMAEVLGWAPQLPMVARWDRARVMGLWAKHCGGKVPQEYVLEFAKIRSLSPEQFVEKLAAELKVKGVVAGADYRFGFRAAGRASDLVRLCQQYGLLSAIVDPVMDAQNLSSQNLIDDSSSKEMGQISTTRIRKALAEGNMKRVTELLGRKHRLYIELDSLVRTGNVIKLPFANVLNQPPGIGSYESSLVLEDSVDTAADLLEAHLRIEETEISLELQDPSLLDTVTQQSRIAVDFLC